MDAVFKERRLVALILSLLIDVARPRWVLAHRLSRPGESHYQPPD
jgi:hypothetical protein